MDQLSMVLFLVVHVITFTGMAECSSCVNDKCEQCQNGTYLGSKGECLTCPEKCTSCSDGEKCDICMAGYYGRVCTDPCPSRYCVNNVCDKGSGYCISGCSEGFFEIGVKCYRCESSCKTCVNSPNTCLECTEGNYGHSCQYNCSHCKEDNCSKDKCVLGCGDGYYQGSDACFPCNTNCTTCSSFEKCQSCRHGSFGSNCQHTCIDCSPCNKDGSCLALPTRTTVTSTLSTTTSSTTSSPSLSVAITGVFSTSPTSKVTDTVIEEGSTQMSGRKDKSSHGDNDEMIIVYAAGGGGGIFAILLIVVVVVVCTRRRSRKESDNNSDDMSMTQNERYVSADDVSNIRAERMEHGINNTGADDNDIDGLYSLPSKTDRPSKVVMETSLNPQEASSHPHNEPPDVPSKQYLYED